MHEAFPLQWPDGWARRPAHARQNSHFAEHIGFARARDELLREVELLGGRDVVLSTNVPLRRDGLPYADSPEPADPGVALYFVRGANRTPVVIACDTYRKVRENLRALGATVEALRAIRRHGATDLLERAFTGFAALPPAMLGDPPWRSVLGVGPDDGLVAAGEAWKKLAYEHHPDRGGSLDRFNQVARAWEKAQKELDPGSGVS